MELTLGNGRDRLNLGRTKLNLSTDQTTQSANRASRSLDRLNRKLNSLGAGAGYGTGSRAGRRAGNRLAGLRSYEDQISDRNSPSKRASAGGRFGKFGKLGKLGALKGAGRFFRPLDMAMQGISLASAISQGDSTDIGATAGDMLGGMGGAAAGGLAGAAIGSVVPVIGTAIGGLIGSIAGGMGGSFVGESVRESAGEWIGSKLGGWFSEDKTDQPAPDAIVKQSQQLQNNHKSMTFAPVLHLTPTGNPSYDQQVSDQVIERLKAEFAQGMMGNMDVATRADGSLGDKRTS